MSASPQRFDFVPRNTQPETLVSPESQSRESELVAQIEGAVQVANQGRLYTMFAVVLTFVAGVLAGYFLYLLWEQVGLHESQIARQQIAIDRLTANGAVVSNQVGRLKAIDNDVDSLKALVQLQSQKIAELERGQNGIHDQMVGMNARWQRDIRELGKVKVTAPSAPPPPAPAPAANAVVPQQSSTPPAVPAPQPSPEKHNETFSPDLKPTPNAYAKMSPSGLVVWMTPRPGFAKPVPTSVIGHVRGLGMLVHDWDDNNHYFITESGSWIPDQR